MLKFLGPHMMVPCFCLTFFMLRVEKRMDRIGRGPPTFLRYWTWLGVMMLLALLGILHTMVLDVMLVSGWLDQERTEALVSAQMLSDDEAASFKDWEQEASLRDYPVLRWFSLTSPLWVVCTFAISLYHIGSHGAAMRRALATGSDRLDDRINCHDKSLRILFLPMVYGLMSFQGVVQMWGVVVNRCSSHHHFHTWKERRDFLFAIYDSSFDVADVYESYALFILRLDRHEGFDEASSGPSFAGAAADGGSVSQTPRHQHQ